LLPARHVVPAGLQDQHLDDGIAIVRREDPEQQLGTELVEAMARLVVRWCHQDQMTAKLDHLHAVPDRLRKIEDVLQRPGVDHDGEAVPQRGRARTVEVVKDGRALPS